MKVNLEKLLSRLRLELSEAEQEKNEKEVWEILEEIEKLKIRIAVEELGWGGIREERSDVECY